jgi:2-polyprenyl-3-methyl-5-hydroxy-6-metoxy-1,4-benzoquinol methylase
MEHIDFTGERYVPEKTSKKLHQDHMERYRFAAGFARGKTVLDIACGVGYGSKILSEAGALSVDGVDICGKTIRYAKQRYEADGIRFIPAGITDYMPGKHYDLIVSFETIEHVSDYKAALNNLSSLLSDKGTLLISSPNRIITNPRCLKITDKPKNRFHTQEFVVSELKAELEEVGLTVCDTVYGQRQQRYFSNRLLKNIYKGIFKPGKRFSPEVTPVANKAPQFFVLIAEKI